MEAQPTALEMRQAEIDAYTANVNNYTNLLATLDGNWDEDLAHLENVEVQEAAKQCPLDRLERLAALQLHKQVSNLLRTETVERFKAQAIYNAMLNN